MTQIDILNSSAHNQMMGCYSVDSSRVTHLFIQAPGFDYVLPQLWRPSLP